MGRLFKAHPLTIWKVVPEEQTSLLEEERTYDLLKNVSFQSIDKEAIQKTYGAVTFEDYRSTDFGPSTTEFGEYVVFSVRIDERKIPNAALQRQVDDAIDEEMKQAKKEGRNFLGKERRKEIKDQIRLKLLAITPPSPSVADVWWNTKTNLLFLTDKSKGFVEALERMWKIAFGINYRLEKLELGLDEEKNILGRNFLTRIWNSFEPTFESAEGYSATVWFSDKVKAADAQETIIANKIGQQSDFDDIRRAVMDGKVIIGGVLTFSSMDTVYEVEVDHLLTPISKISVPPVTHHEEDDIYGATMLQIDRVETAFGLLVSLFQWWKQQDDLDVDSEEFKRRLKAGARQAAEDLKGTLPEGTTMTIETSDGEKVEVA